MDCVAGSEAAAQTATANHILVIGFVFMTEEMLRIEKTCGVTGA
jgi:hypothetical protein